MPRTIDQEALDSPNLKILDINNPPTKQVPHESFPKMVYLHPKDKTQEHRTKIVSDSDELDAAEEKGWRTTPHIPIEPPEDLSKDYAIGDFDTTPADPLNAMLKPALIEEAKRLGISVDVASKKEVILAAIKAGKIAA